jgi:hypothetical protein
VTRKLGDKDPLNGVIDRLDLKNVGAYEAVRILAQQEGVNIVSLAPSGSAGNVGGTVSLSLRRVTVRDALKQITKAAGLCGWTAIISLIKTGPNKGRIFTTISF